MSKPYLFDSPFITLNGLKEVAEIIKTNYPTNEDLESAIGNVDLSSIESALNNKVDKVSGKELVSTSDITQITTNKTNIEDLQTRVGSIESDLDGLLAVLEEVV